MACLRFLGSDARLRGEDLGWLRRGGWRGNLGWSSQAAAQYKQAQKDGNGLAYFHGLILAQFIEICS